MSRILFALVCSSLLFFNTPHPNAPSFEGAELISATDLSYPVRSIAVGAVVLETTVNEKGAVEDVRPIREIQSLTETALHAVKQWHFKPAILDGKTVRSRTTVAVVFNSVATYPYETALGPISETEARSDSSLEPEPISVTAASFVRYPSNTRTTGTVVLRAAIDTEGSVERVVAIRDVPALTEPCVETLKRWKFQPAYLHRHRISSSISVAFVLRPPNGSSRR